MKAPINITHNQSVNRFETTIEGATGYISYQDQGDTYVFDHTMVPNELEGQGIGSALVRHALDYAQAEGKTVVPQCSFVASYISRHPEYQTLIN